MRLKKIFTNPAPYGCHRRMVQIVAIACLITGTVVAQGQSEPAIPHKSVETFDYAIRGNDTLRLDFYSPCHARPDSACVIYLYGGAFINGARDDKLTCLDVEALLRCGFAVAAIDYRKHLSTVDFLNAPKSSLFDHLDTATAYATADCAAALGFVHRYATQLQVSASHLILTGSSAGGFAVLTYDFARIHNLPLAYGTAMGDTPLHRPVCRLDSMTTQTYENLAPVRPAAIVSLSGAVFAHKSSIKYPKATDTNAVQPAPTAFFYGDNDKVVPLFHISLFGSHYMGGKKLSSVFQKNGLQYWTFCYKEHGHEVSAYLHRTMNEYQAFVDIVFAHRPIHYHTECADDDLHVTKASSLTLIGILKSDDGFEGLFDEE